MTARIIVLHERRTVPVVFPDDGNVTGPVSDGDGPMIMRRPVVSYGPSATVNDLSSQGIPSSRSTESCPSDAGRMGEVVNIPMRDRPVAVGVHSGAVVPFPNGLVNRWDRAIANIGVGTEATDAQLRDVFLLMVAEMSGMVVPRKGGGRYY